MSTHAAVTGDGAPAMGSGLSVLDATAMLVGVVVGIGIFGFPPLVAQHAWSPASYMAMWTAGGLLMLVGALCYAELGSAYPDTGGEYTFLVQAWGRKLGMLFAWARGTIIQTGAIAAVAFIFGDYAQRLLPLGGQGPAWYAALVVAVLTAVNMAGTLESRLLQRLLTLATVLAMLMIAIAGLMLPGAAGLDAAPGVATPGVATPDGAAALVSPAGPASLAGSLGMGMVFVLLTYGGWNEAAYLSGEIRDVRRNMSRVLLLGSLVVTAIYLLVNLAYLRVFGLHELRGSQAVGADMMSLLAGSWAAVLLSLVVCCTALGTINACIFTGARVYHALGRDVPALHSLAAWRSRGATPARALALQGAITLLLIWFGAVSEGGLQAMVAYTAPVFWLFMLLTALAVIVLRRRDGAHTRSFRVPLYPLTPLLFAATCLALFLASARYAGAGAWLGLLVLAAGLPLLWLRKGDAAKG